MPIYEYKCQSCGHEHEALQKLSDQPLVHCPACSKPDLIKKNIGGRFPFERRRLVRNRFQERREEKCCR